MLPSLTSDSPLRTQATTNIIGYRLRRAQLAVFQRFIVAFEMLDLRPSEYSVLTLIADNPGRKQTEIAEVLGIKRANFVSLIRDLENRGLVERHVAPGDRRANALHFTASGKAFFDKARAIQDTFETDCVKKLGGPVERDRLFALLDRLCA
jgi:DNA-binding MarR family transcriptional regulator